MNYLREMGFGWMVTPQPTPEVSTLYLFETLSGHNVDVWLEAGSGLIHTEIDVGATFTPAEATRIAAALLLGVSEIEAS